MFAKVSVILPSLNVARYIRECVESVMNQTLKDIEIICVDAGSTDGTLEILREYEQRDPRIKVIVSDRKSYGYQMNLGMAAAKGKYVGIVETDDYVPYEMYEELYTVAKENDVDFVKADFYRFTRENGKENKGYHKLTSDSRYYNRLIDPLDLPICFTFLMNTWSGIYKREFLKDNNILHNETPGASYQDNGFWFQTLMHAKKVYFVNRAYYMNRRDNPDSSVFNKKKVFCISDEFLFIKDRLRQIPDLFEKMKYIYSYTCHQAYKSNLNRIEDDDKLAFLARYSEDFRNLREDGALDESMFSVEDWDMILSIMESAEDYYRQEIHNRSNVNKQIREHSKVIIYGAGMVGKRVFHELKYSKKPIDITCFAVSKMEDNVGSYMDTPIYDIHKLLKWKEDSVIVVATTKLYQEEMIENARQLGFKHILPIPDGVERMDIELLKKGETREALEAWYKYKTGERLNLDNPGNFNQKMQWLKLNENKNITRIFSDRLEMRKWLITKVGKEKLIPLIGIYDYVEDIPFDELPDKFVIQCTHGIKWRAAIEDKNNIELFKEDKLKRRLDKWLHLNYAYSSELDIHSVDVVPRLMIEEAVENSVRHDEHIVLCFQGEPVYFISDVNKGVWGGNKRDLFDIKGRHIDAKMGCQNSNKFSAVHFKEMIDLAVGLSKGFRFMAIYFFDTEKGILLNRVSLTFENGICPIFPEKLNIKMGELLKY